MPEPNTPNPSEAKGDSNGDQKATRPRISLKKLPNSKQETLQPETQQAASKAPKLKLQLKSATRSKDLPAETSASVDPPEVAEAPETSEKPPEALPYIEPEAKEAPAPDHTQQPSPVPLPPDNEATLPQAVEEQAAPKATAQPKVRHLAIRKKEREPEPKVEKASPKKKPAKRKRKPARKASGSQRKWPIFAVAGLFAVALFATLGILLIKTLFPESDEGTSIEDAALVASVAASPEKEPVAEQPVRFALSMKEISTDTAQERVQKIKSSDLRVSRKADGLFVERVFYPIGSVVDPSHGLKIHTIRGGSGGFEVILRDAEERDYFILLR